ncbi:MAG: aromatic ring-hydroxylating dioxygenase subunit alpha [Betaproteobacteria bacterium]|nr:aromatic ring-hydroxylating dioxygenase subunit alpha [Betaproteobacteria bacterium]
MTGFLQNQWYAAATSQELGAKPLGRRICNESIAMFRRRDGSVAAVTDRCPHRKVPLSIGNVVGDEIKCAYHGFQFNSLGACTLIPSQKEVPKGAFDIRSFPVVERYALVFVWMGDPRRADPALLPDFHENDSPGWSAAHGYLRVAAHYQLLIDNLLDLTHLPYVHKTTLAGPGIVDNPMRVEVVGDTVRARRDMPNVDPAPIHRVLRHFPGKIDRYQDFDFRPPVYIHLNLGANPAGSDEDRSIPHHVVMNSLTPETESSTHYFWSIAQCVNPDPAVMQTLYELNKMAFDEDTGILEAQQAAIDADPAGLPLGAVAGDHAGVLARRIVARKLAEEASATPHAAS